MLIRIEGNDNASLLLDMLGMGMGELEHDRDNSHPENEAHAIDRLARGQALVTSITTQVEAERGEAKGGEGGTE